MNKNLNSLLKQLLVYHCFNFIPRKGDPNAGKKDLAYAIFFIGILAIGFLTCSDASAATTTGSADVLSGAYTSVSALLKGSFTKIITAISLAFGLIGCALKFNPMAIVSSFGVGIAAGVGPTAVESLVSALF